MQKIILFLQKEIWYSEVIFTIFRFLFGVYLGYYFLASLPYVVEIYSNQGMLPRYIINFDAISFFPNILYLIDTPLFIKLFTVFGALLSLLFAFGFYPRIASFLLWYVQTCFLGRNVLTQDPSLEYIGLLLILFSLVPQSSSVFHYLKKSTISFTKKISIPFLLLYMPLFIFSISFFMSGVNKMQAQSWLNGNALTYILQLPLAEQTGFNAFLISHPHVAVPLSFLALASQLIVLPLFLIGDYRSSLYISVLEFLFAFLVLKINQVTLGMLLFFLFFIVRDVHPENIFSILKRNIKK